MDADWLEEVYLATDRLFTTRLGPDIREAARDYCPVFGGQNSTATEVSMQIAESLAARGQEPDPGALRDSIEDHLNGHTLIVSANGSAERSYAYYVETGHHIVVFGRSTGRYKEAQPFLRPALFEVRTP
jgi:hypothetical protein